MPSREEMEAIGRELESCRDRLLERRMTEDDVWALLQRVEALLRACADDDPDHERLAFMYSMLESVWSNTRHVEALRRLRGA